MNITPYAKNAKKHPQKQIDKLAAIVKEVGWRQPILVNQTGVIVAGHGRWETYQQNHDLPEPWVIDDAGKTVMGEPANTPLTEEQEKAYRLADNKLAETDVDMGLVVEELKELEELAPLTGYDMDLLVEPDEADDEVPETPEEPKSKLGDLYEIGEHRVLCGDSTKLEDVERLMDGKKADISFTSPPYNAGDNIRGKFYDNDGDNKGDDDYVSFLVTTTLNALEHCDFNFVNLGILESNKFALIDFQTQMRDYTKDVLVWNKKTAPPHINKGTLSTKWEYVFAFSKEPKSRSFPCSWQGKYSNVIETENNSGNEFADVHRAGFPVAFPTWVIQTMDFTKSVIDLFCGTGTTLIAAEKTSRICYGMELDPKYVDVIVQRYVDYVDNPRVILNGEDVTELWQKTVKKA